MRWTGALCSSHLLSFHQVVVPLQYCLSPWQLSLRRVDVGAMGSEDVLFKRGSKKLYGCRHRQFETRIMQLQCLIIVLSGPDMCVRLFVSKTESVLFFPLEINCQVSIGIFFNHQGWRQRGKEEGNREGVECLSSRVCCFAATETVTYNSAGMKNVVSIIKVFVAL